MALNKWMWFGLVFAALGWLLLLSGSIVPSIIPAVGPLPSPILSAVSTSAIFSGFAIAILAALTQGFGSLDRFFTAALERSASRAEAPPLVAEPAPEPPANRVIDRGFIDNSIYRVFGDGTVEVETLLGSRRFASLKEAQEFVGVR